MNNETRISKVSNVNSRLWAGGALVAALAMSGCGAADESAPAGGGESAASPGETSAQPRDSGVAPAQPSPVASLTLANGNVIAFYDFKSGVLVSETGRATEGPVLVGTGESVPVDELVATWTRLAPDTPVPEALTELQERMMNLPESEVPRDKSTPEFAAGGDFLQPPPASSDGIGRSVEALQQGCNNNCCDLDWLKSSFSQCRPQNYPNEWLLFNYYWSYSWGNSVIIYQGLVCAASGTSQYTVNVRDFASHQWLIPEGQWLSYQFNAGHSFFGGWDEKDVDTTVNTGGFGDHLHSYCGHMAYGD